MRIVLITQGVSRIVEPLFAKFDIVGVVESAPRDYKSHGVKAFFRQIKMLISLFLAKDKTLKSYCRNRNVPYQLLAPGSDAEVCGWLDKLSPDLIVVFSMSQLLKASVISIPKFGVINLHPSYLPSYRGPNPDFWQYYDCEQNPGVTVHYINEGEDTGDVIHQERVHIPLGTKSPDRLNKLVGDVGVKLLIQSILDIENGTVRAVAQPAESPTKRARNIKIDEHNRLVDWERWPVERIWNLLRGTELWLNAIAQPSGLFRGQRWMVGECEHTKPPAGIEPGSIFHEKSRTFVACKDGRVELFLRFNLRKMIRGFLNL